jgi:hypothetical protein
MESLLDFSCKEGGEDILKPMIGNESLLEMSNNNRIRVVDFDTFKNLSQKYDVPTLQYP